MTSCRVVHTSRPRGDRATAKARLVMTTSIWDIYLDPTDAAVVLEALVILERERAVREPLPLNDASRLLARLRTIARISAEEATYWDAEATERHLEADVDGGRWGSVAVARRMRGVAHELAEGSRVIATAALAAVDDLAPRLTEPASDEVRAAAEATVEQARALLSRPDDADLTSPASER